MNEKEFNNTFRFILKQGDVLFCEKIFDADKFNPYTRYSIDIRDILPRAIIKLQKTLSKLNYVLVDYSPEEHSKYSPPVITRQIEEKTIKGVECKIGFYINENPIVERLFYVDGFNPLARWSVEVVEAVSEITNTIFAKIKSTDEKNMWDDYDLINTKGMSINQIREISPAKREELLKTMKK